MKPRIFISTVSAELRSVRQLTANVLQGLGYDPVWQEIFGTEPGDLRQVLRDKIDECEGLIQIVGRGYGAEPPEPDLEFGRVSYTQYEFLYARRRGKKTWVLFAGDGCTHDRPLEALDLPRDPGHPDPAAYQAERRALQDAWRQRLSADRHLWHGAASDTELELRLERLKSEFADLRRRFRRWQKLVAGLGAAVLILVSGVLLVQWRTKRTTEEGLQQIKQLGTAVAEVRAGQTVTAARIRVQLLEASEKALAAALAEADKEPRFDERERLRQQAEKAHEIRLSRIDELAASFAALDKQAETSPVLREMIRIFNDEKVNPVDKAIAYAERQRPALLERVRARKQAEQERTRAELEPLLKAAALERTRGRPDAARARFQELLDLEPDWPQALESYAYFLYDRAVQSEYHGSLQAALADARHCFDLATRLHSQDQSKPAGQRVLCAACYKLGDVLVICSQPGDTTAALQHYTQGLELAEDLLKRNPDSADAARDVSVSLEKLGNLLAKRGQPGDAELALKHYSRGLEIREDLLKRNPDSADAARDVSVSLQRLGELLAQRGQPDDAELALKHYTRGLEISEDLLKRNPDSAQAARDVSVSLNKLGELLGKRGQTGDAELALKHYTRGLEISEALLKRNPDSAQAARDVSLSLEKLGELLAKRGQTGDAELALKHYTRGLEIREDLLNRNPDSAEVARDVSVSLEKLGELLAKRGQPGDAELALKHYTRGLKISEDLLNRNPDSAQAARDVSISLEMLGELLAKRGQPGDAELALKHLTRDLEISEALLKRNLDSAQAARDVSVSLQRLGELLETRGRTGDAELALKHYTHGLEIGQDLLKRNPDSAEAARDVSISLEMLGDLLAQRGQPGDAEQAMKHCTRGLEIREGLLKRNPDSPVDIHNVTVSHYKLGDLLATRGQTGDVELALKHYTRGLKISEALLNRNPDSAQAARDVSISLEKLGELLAKRGQPGDAELALKHLTRDLEISEALLKRNPDSAQAARDVSVSLEKLGELVGKRGQPGDAEQALKHNSRGLEIREDLLKQNPDSAQAARDVSLSLNKLGELLAQRGQPGDAEQALKHYTRGLEIREALLKRNPDSADAAREVTVSHYKLGELDVRLNRFESAAVRFGMGIAVLDGMIARGLNAGSAAQAKTFLQERLQFCRTALATGDWDALLKTAPELLPGLLSLRATALAAQGRLADVAQAGARLRELEPKSAGNLYNAACAYGLCAAFVIKDQPTAAQGDEAERTRYIGLALDCLKEAIAAGFKDFDHMQQDSDLAALRDLAGFRSLLPQPAGK